MTTATELCTERLLLRRFQTGDVGDAQSYRDDLEFARFLPHIPQPFTRRDAEAFVALNMSEPWQRSPTFAVVLNGRVIGTVNLEVDAATDRDAGLCNRTSLVGAGDRDRGRAGDDGVGDRDFWPGANLGVN
jgi:RimJ/RimL family protein N-acetyltransferase